MYEQTDRHNVLNAHPVRGDGRIVLYWMQQAQRAEDNHALEAAISLANELCVPVVAVFVLMPDYPSANLRHITFLLEGLRDTVKRLQQRGVGWAGMLGDPVQVVPRMVERLRASALITDRGYLRHQRHWRQQIAAEITVSMCEVDSDCVIPCTLFPKEEYSAHTLRGKYWKRLPFFLQPVTQLSPSHAPPIDRFSAFDIVDIPATLRKLHADDSVPPSVCYSGGATQAEALLDRFVNNHLAKYRTHRQDAAANSGSHLSPYLHFGQISPLRVAIAITRASGGDDLSIQSYLDELLIRRELSINFVWHNQHYDSPLGWPAWARRTLDIHREDPRSARYSRERLAAGETDDPIWNAAQKELLSSGVIHNYPRMLWAKKLLEWSEEPEHAWEIAIWLNDRFALDGRDANGYANIAWCQAGKHDRPWPQRPIYGAVRYMSTARAGAHFSTSGYLARVNSLCQLAGIDPVGSNDAPSAVVSRFDDHAL